MIIQMIGWFALAIAAIFLVVNSLASWYKVIEEEDKFKMFQTVGLFLIVAAICFK